MCVCVCVCVLFSAELFDARRLRRVNASLFGENHDAFIQCLGETEADIIALNVTFLRFRFVFFFFFFFFFLLSID